MNALTNRKQMGKPRRCGGTVGLGPKEPMAYYQHNTICECKASFWSIEDHCNKCGIERPRKLTAPKAFSRAGKPPKGQNKHA